MAFSSSLFKTKATQEGYAEEYTSDVLAYAQKLENNGLPVIFSRKHLAILMGVQYGFLTHVIENTERYYRYFLLQKKNKSAQPREIMAPEKELKSIQKWIANQILDKVPVSEACKGFRKDISILHNAKPHEKPLLLLKVDLLKYFDTITEKRVYGLFKMLGYHPNLAVDLARLCTARHRRNYWDRIQANPQEAKVLQRLIQAKPRILPQGASTSPTIANLMAWKLDKRFLGMKAKNNFNYTRYADDLTFSINSKDVKLPSKEIIKSIIEEEGFYLNEKKLRYLKPGMKQHVTGLTVTHGVFVPKAFRKKVQQHIYYAKKYGPLDHMKKWEEKEGRRKNHYGFQDWLHGNIAYIYSIQPNLGNELLKEYNKINWEL
jgi:RNA-directed DNA polymerase